MLKILFFIFCYSIWRKDGMPYIESMKRGSCTNPYGWIKYMLKQILEGVAKAYSEMSVVLLKCFNSVGTNEYGLIGEDYNNLIPYVTQVAVRKQNHLTVFGGIYNIVDGKCHHDFICVVDLAQVCVKAIEYVEENKGRSI